MAIPRFSNGDPRRFNLDGENERRFEETFAQLFGTGQNLDVVRANASALQQETEAAAARIAALEGAPPPDLTPLTTRVTALEDALLAQGLLIGSLTSTLGDAINDLLALYTRVETLEIKMTSVLARVYALEHP